MDARSLLRAKKAEARIEHPYATYNASGQLRCSVCAVPVKQWDAHLLTKAHRTSAAREKAQEQARAAKASSASSKAKRPAVDDGTTGGSSTKRSRAEDAPAEGGSGSGTGPKGLPAGFFSAGNRPTADDDEDDDDGKGEAADELATQSEPAVTAGPGSAVVQAPPPTGDAELDDFFASLAQPGDAPPQAATALQAGPATTTRRKGGPVKSSYKTGDASLGVASYEAAPVRAGAPGSESNANGDANAGDNAAAEPEETEAERRARIEREEREEIMNRLEEEERAQEDADSRVIMLKQRMEALKKRREAKGTAGVSGKQANGVKKA